MNIDAGSIKAYLSPQGVYELVKFAEGTLTATDEAGMTSLTPSDRAEHLFQMGVERIAQKQLLAIIQKLPRVVYSASPDDEPEDLNALPTAELETRVADAEKINAIVREARTGEVARVSSVIPVIKTVADAEAFRERMRRERLIGRLSALNTSTGQMARAGFGLDGKGSQGDRVDTVCVDCGAVTSVPATWDLSRGARCKSCYTKYKAKNKTGT